MNKLVFYVPEEALAQVKAALFEVGLGRYKNYDFCSWETKGVGQFRPLDGSHPHIGTQNSIEKVLEYRVEMLCEDALIEQAITVLKATHPYEEPAFEIWPIRIA